MTTEQKQAQVKAQQGKAGTYTSTTFVLKKQAPKKSITLLDILLGRK